MKQFLLYFGATLILILIGFFMSISFFDLSLAQLKPGNTQLVSKISGGLLIKKLTFSFFLGIIPLLHWIIGKLSHLKSNGQGLLTLAIITASGLGLWQYRISVLNAQMNHGDEVPITIDIQHLKFELFLGLGFIIGAIISILIFRIKNKTFSEK